MKCLKRMIQLAAIGSFFIPTAVLAGLADGTITFIGKGDAARAPEISRLQILVTSLCYETAVSAKEANASLAKPLVDIMTSFKKSPDDKVAASGGPSLRQTETIPVPGGQYKVLCEKKWRTENRLSLVTTDMDHLSEIQDSLLSKIDAEAVSADLAAQTYAELSQPSFGLKEGTMRDLKIESQGRAWEDAKLQLQGFSGRCELQNLKLIKISPPQHSVIAKYADGTESDISTPILPEEISVRSELEFVWTFDPVRMNCGSGN